MNLEIKLQAFEGPLELLLHLIDKNKVNIYDIPIVTITEQYLEYVYHMEEQDYNVMSDFLVMAATLISIKAKMLLPKEEKEEEEEDPRDELVRRLIEYKMYKFAAMELKDMELDGGRNFYKDANIPKEVLEYKEEVDPKELVDGITLVRLNEIFQSMMKRQVEKVDPIRSKFGKIEREEISLEDRMEEIRNSIQGLNNINFRTLFDKIPTKPRMIVTFLAILELMKTGKIVIRQDAIFGEIWIDSLENQEL